MKLVLRKMGILVMTSALVFGMLAGCSDEDSGDKGGADSSVNGIDWNDESTGTLTVKNNTNKDMILFQGQTPSASNILGGVRATSSRTFDVSDDVDNFDVGGYMILRGISKDEYEKNKWDFSVAKVEYSGLVIYGSGKKFHAEINSGDYYFKLTNEGKIGIELRKNSPDGEKIGYIPALASNYAIYCNSSDALTIYPAYVYYNKSTGKVVTVGADNLYAYIAVAPRPATDSNVSTKILPSEDINSLSSPVAYITCINNVENQSAYLTKSANIRLLAQNGYDLLDAGETNTFEIASTEVGSNQNLIVTLDNGSIKVPVKDASGNEIPIKNGYEYTVTVLYNGQGAGNSAHYSAVIVEGTNRNIAI